MNIPLPIALVLSVILSMTSLGCGADTECPTIAPPPLVVELEDISLDDLDALLTESNGEVVEIPCEATDDAGIVRCTVPFAVSRGHTLRLQLDLEDGRSLGFEEQLGGECHPEPNPLRIRVPAP